MARATVGVLEVLKSGVLWLGHRMLTKVTIARIQIFQKLARHDIAEEVHHRLIHQLKYLSNASAHANTVSLVNAGHIPYKNSA